MLEQRIQQQFFDSADLKYAAAAILSRPIADAVQALVNCITAGGKVLTCGNGGSAGSLSFANQTDLFVISLKAGNAFSLYEFDGSTVLGGISSISFDTLGVGFFSGNPNHPQEHFGQGLSHANIYAPPVPEPETYAMLLAGLGLVSLVARRRNV